MTYKLFIDDERFPVDDSWVVVRTSQEAVEYVTDHGTPSFISFDHDLGGDDTAMLFLSKFIDMILDGMIVFNKDLFDFYVHSQNPIGKKNIEGLLNSFIKQF